MTKPKRGKVLRDFRRRVNRLVRQRTTNHNSQLAAVGAIAPMLGCRPDRLRRQMRKAEDAMPAPAEK
jgi:hypothetical protein